jgi:hypothetical protein
VATFADVLARFQPADAEADLEWCEKRVLLNQVGLHGDPARLSLEHLFAHADTVSLGSEFPVIDQLALRVDRLRHSGRRTSACARRRCGCRKLLLGLASHRFREYELRRATRLLRTAIGLIGPDQRMLAPCRDFLMLHQDMGGAFGFFGPAHDEVLRDAAPGFSFDS